MNRMIDILFIDLNRTQVQWTDISYFSNKKVKTIQIY